LRAAGWTLSQIGTEMGVTRQAVSAMLAKLKAAPAAG
jgi:DNA-binding transcriptional regulator LsrR (DeoR family)